MIRSSLTHAAFILHAVVFTAAIALAVVGAEHRSKQATPKQLSFPALSQRQVLSPSDSHP